MYSFYLFAGSVISCLNLARIQANISITVSVDAFLMCIYTITIERNVCLCLLFYAFGLTEFIILQ